MHNASPENSRQSESRVDYLYDSGDYNLDEYSELEEIIEKESLNSINELGYILVSKNPPIWILDIELKKFGFPENIELDNITTINNPGAYNDQKKVPLKINKKSELNYHLKKICNDSTFIDNNKNLYLKMYSKKNKSLLLRGGGSIAPIYDKNDCLDRLHIDRSRNDKTFRKPMKFTMIICHNNSGSIHFPFGICENISLDKIEKIKTSIDSGSITNKNNTNLNQWHIINNENQAGLKINSKPGRIILFASSDKNNIPLYRSLHQGLDDLSTVESRMISVMGWDGEYWETGGYHECIEHETIETRASFFNRTIEEEAVGMTLTKSYRTGEARAFLNKLAINRNTTIQNLISEVINSSNNKEIANNINYNINYEEKPKIIYTDENNCPICFGEFIKSKESISSENLLIPGYLSCGHLLCETCYNEMKSHYQLRNTEGAIKCMSCRNYSKYWKALFQ